MSLREVVSEIQADCCQDKNDLLSINGIDPERVDRWGARFLKLVKNARAFYDTCMRAQDGQPDDPNHEVIPISSEEELGDEEPNDSQDFAFDAESDENPQVEADPQRSRYFDTDTDIYDFNERSN